MSDENLGINIDLNSILGISDEQEPAEQPEPQEKPRAQRARCHTERGQKMFDKRRFFSEKALLDTAEWYYQQGDSPAGYRRMVLPARRFLLLYFRRRRRQLDLPQARPKTAAAEILPLFDLVLRHRGCARNRPLGRKAADQTNRLLCRRDRKSQLRRMHVRPYGNIRKDRRQMRRFPEPFKSDTLLRRTLRLRDPIIGKHKHEPENREHRRDLRHVGRRFLQVLF